MLRLASTSTANLSYLVISAYALLGRAQAIQALALSWLFTMLNPALGAEAPIFFICRHIVLAAAAISVFFYSGFLLRFNRIDSMVRATLALGIFLVVHSYFFSRIVDVSIMRAVSWTVAMTTIISAWSGLSLEVRDLLAHKIFIGLILLLVISLPLLLIPEVGYLRNGTGFQGILNHPQVFGSTMGILGAWAAGEMFAHRRPSWAAMALMGACVAMVVLSEARVGGFSLVFGVAIAVLVAPALSGKSIRLLLPGIGSARIYLVAILALVSALIAKPLLSQRVGNYIAKGSTATNLIEAYTISRGGMIEIMQDNIEGEFLHGIGFGIASVPTLMIVKRDPLLNLPISASIEKGVLPLAVFEELGLFGFLVVAAWIWMLLRRSAHGGVVPCAVSITALMTNMAEFTLFSPGGMGLLLLVLLGWGTTSGHEMRLGR